MKSPHPRAAPHPRGAVNMAVVGAVLFVVLLGGAAWVFFRPGGDSELDKLERLIAAANTACVSNSEVENAAKVGADLSLLVTKIKGEGGISEYRKKNIGANRALPAELQLPENAQIRQCMSQYMPAIFKAIGIELPATPVGEARLPEPLQLRFSYSAGAASAVAMDDTLRISLETRRRVFAGERLAKQPAGHYSYNTAYPAADDRILGTLTREVSASTLHEAPAPTRFCLRRPTPLQASDDEYVHLDCAESGMCEMHFPSPKWLEACALDKPKVSSRGFGLLSSAWAAENERRWTVPSAQTLDAHKDRLQGVGYTLFETSTGAFRDPKVIGVEVDIRVNGVPIHEDGLAPALRPVPNDPERDFNYRFALESLDFEGAEAGCEAITVALRPRFADGKGAGETLRATLAYVALRDSTAATVPLGSSTLNWQARYVVPPDEWSHEAFITSVIFPKSGGEAAAQAARERSVALKRSFDRLALRFEGRPLVAVIRPPLTDSAGTLAYGLTAGLVQPSGQVRFTFSSSQANAIGDQLHKVRGTDREAASVIDREKFIYRIAGNRERRETPTPVGVCKHVKAV